MKKITICSGSYMNDLDSGFDLVEWCNYRKLTDDEHNKIIGEKLHINFLIDNPHLYHDVEEGDDIPLMSDTYFTFFVFDEKQLEQAKKYVRDEFDEILSN